MSHDTFPTNPAPDSASAPTGERAPTTIYTNSSMTQEVLDRLFHEARESDADFIYMRRKRSPDSRLVLVSEGHSSSEIIRVFANVTEFKEE